MGIIRPYFYDKGGSMVTVDSDWHVTLFFRPQVFGPMSFWGSKWWKYGFNEMKAQHTHTFNESMVVS